MRCVYKPAIAVAIALNLVSVSFAGGYSNYQNYNLNQVNRSNLVTSTQQGQVILRNNNSQLRQQIYSNPNVGSSVISLGNNQSYATQDQHRFNWINQSAPYGYGYNSGSHAYHGGYGHGGYYNTSYVNSYPHRPYQTPVARGSTVRYKAAVPIYSGGATSSGSSRAAGSACTTLCK